MEKTELKIPEVGEYVRHLGRLVKIEDVTPVPPPPERDYIFEDIEARCELIYRDEVLRHVATFNDFYGFETSVENAIKEMKEYAEKKQITKDSELEVRITKVVSQIRMKPTNQKNFYAPIYCDFEYKNIGRDSNLPDPIETIVWSTRW
jgi:hypothetical protein